MIKYFLFAILMQLFTEHAWAANLQIQEGNLCPLYLTDGYRVSGKSETPVREFQYHALGKTPSHTKYERIEDLSSNLMRAKNPEIFLNAYLDVLEVGGSVKFKISNAKILTVDKKKLSFFVWMKNQSEMIGFEIEKVDNNFVKLTKRIDTDNRFHFLKKKLLGNFIESIDRPMPFKDRFSIYEGEFSEKESTAFENAYSLGWGDNGDVFRFVLKSNPRISYVRKRYHQGFIGFINKFFELRGLRLLQNASAKFPVYGVSVVKVKGTIWNRVYLEDMRGVSYQEIISSKNMLTESEMGYIYERLKAFETSINEYMKYRFPLSTAEKNEIKETIRQLKYSEPKLTKQEIKDKAEKWYQEHYGTVGAKWDGNFDVNITLNPFSPGFLMPLSINLAPHQIVIDPKTLHITIIDPQ